MVSGGELGNPVHPTPCPYIHWPATTSTGFCLQFQALTLMTFNFDFLLKIWYPHNFLNLLFTLPNLNLDFFAYNLISSQFLARYRGRCCNRRRMDTSRVANSCEGWLPGSGPGRGSRRSPGCSRFPARRTGRSRGTRPNIRMSWIRVLEKQNDE